MGGMAYEAGGRVGLSLGEAGVFFVLFGLVWFDVVRFWFGWLGLVWLRFMVSGLADVAAVMAAAAGKPRFDVLVGVVEPG